MPSYLSHPFQWTMIHDTLSSCFSSAVIWTVVLHCDADRASLLPAWKCHLNPMPSHRGRAVASSHSVLSANISSHAHLLLMCAGFSLPLVHLLYAHIWHKVFWPFSNTSHLLYCKWSSASTVSCLKHFKHFASPLLHVIWDFLHNLLVCFSPLMT